MTTSRRPGFALPAVLAVTGVVTLVFLVAITALASLTSEAASARARVRFLQRAMTAEASIVYIAATEPTNAQGFSAGSPRSMEGTAIADAVTPPDSPNLIHLDGRMYVSKEDANLGLSLRDQAGMINLSVLDDAGLQRLASQLGMTTSKARALRALQTDYTDQDDLRQPNGAERLDYGGYLPNRPFLRPSEWLSLLGVRQGVDATRWRAIRSELAADHTLPSINVNTASSMALQILLGTSARQAETAIQARKTVNFNSPQAFDAATGATTPFDSDQTYTYLSGRIIYTIPDGLSPWVYRARLTMTPFGREQPIWIDQTELTEAPRRAVADISHATQLPYTPR